MAGLLRRLWLKLNGADKLILTSGRAITIIGGLWRDIQERSPNPHVNIVLSDGRGGGDTFYGRQEILADTTKFFRQLIADCGDHQSGVASLVPVPAEALSRLTPREIAVLAHIPADTRLGFESRRLAEDLDEVWCELHQMPGDSKDYSARALRLRLGIP